MHDAAENSVGMDSWANPTRRRHELTVVLAFCLITFVVPLVFRELYPFSTPTMFARELHEHVSYVVKAPDGTRLSSRSFGLQLNNPDDPPLRNFGRYGYGRQSPPSLRDYDLLATQEEVTRQVQDSLRVYPQIPFVLVARAVIGAIDSDRVGITAETSWQVTNPLYERSGR